MTVSTARLATAALVLAPFAVFAAPKDDVRAAAAKFMSAKAYHATLEGNGIRTDLDFQAPDRYRVSTPVGTQVIVGDTAYMNFNGRHMKVPLPKGTTNQWRQPSQWSASVDALTCTALGAEATGGRPAKKYRCDAAKPASSTVLWISADGYPAKAVATVPVNGKPMTSTITYSRYNDPSIVINAK